MMKAGMTRGLMALSTVAWLATGATANDELRFSELEQRLSSIEQLLTERQGVQTASFLEEDGVTTSACGCDSGYSSCNGCCNEQICCNPCCCRSSGWYGEAEMLFLRYHRADGVRAGAFSNVPPATTDDLEFDFEEAPRLTIGYIASNGIGGRVRYFEYDHSGEAIFPASGVAMDVDTYNIDFELFDRIQIGSNWLLELSGGVRYNQFEETMFDPIPAPGTARLNEFHGWGGIVGLEAVRKINSWAAVYGRARGAILMDDKRVSNVGAVNNDAILTDVTLSVFELAIGGQVGYDTRYARTVLRAGLEWQQWNNFSSSFTPFTSAPGNAATNFAGQSDVGFAGFTVGVIVSR